MNHANIDIKAILLEHGLDMAGSFETCFTWEQPVRIYPAVELMNVFMGAYSYAAPRASLAYASIGRYCSIGNEVLMRGSAHPTQWLTTHPLSYQNIYRTFADYQPPFQFDGYSKITQVGHDVWIGNRAVLLPGVKIGHGAVIGAGTVVAKDVPDYAVVVGNPGRVVKYRFDEKTIARLLKAQWWQYDMPKMMAAHASLPLNDPLAMLDLLESQTIPFVRFDLLRKQIVSDSKGVQLRTLQPASAQEVSSKEGADLSENAA
ncbi:CatB-related O-acetyltransferase [Microvirga sp. 2TAF3]|uniref:CatB-related O-acetyltransferase n=1 Tax=Microvirga sp. 2TAF3 TaxID=3233014 RepID=UPI003F95B18D